MAQGIDVLGENNNEIVQTSGRTMGYVKVGVLVTVTAIISICIIILGIIITK